MRQGHMNEAEQIEADGFPIDHRGVAANDTLALELAHALLQSWAGQLQPAGQLGGGQPRILLQMREQLPVEGVELGPGAAVARPGLCQ